MPLTWTQSTHLQSGWNVDFVRTAWRNEHGNDAGVLVVELLDTVQPRMRRDDLCNLRPAQHRFNYDDSANAIPHHPYRSNVTAKLMLKEQFEGLEPGLVLKNMDKSRRHGQPVGLMTGVTTCLSVVEHGVIR